MALAWRCRRAMESLAHQPSCSSQSVFSLAPRRWPADAAPHTSAMATSSTSLKPLAPASSRGGGAPNSAATADWSEQEFGALQKRATSRLHRFYVPQPLGPTPEPATLEALLLAAAPTLSPMPSTSTAPSQPTPLPAPPTAAPTSAPSGRRKRGAAAANDGVAPAASAPGSFPPATTVPASVVLEGEEARHASRALRLQSGDRVELCDGRGNVAAGTVTGTDKQRVWITTDGAAAHEPWSGSRWVVAVACTTLKGGRAEWLVEKLAELGAYIMVPLVTERSQAAGKAKFRTSRAADSDGGDSGGGDDYQPGRLERVAIAATKQSLRPHALHLAPPTPLKDVLPLVRRAAAAAEAAADAAQAEAVVEAAAEAGAARSGEGRGGGVGSGGRGFSLVAVAGAPPLTAVLQELRAAAPASGSPAGAPPALAASTVVFEAMPAASTGAGAAAAKPAAGGAGTPPLRVLFIGPEGDFTPAELASLVEAGARPVGLGANRLRTETAAVGLLAACLLTEDGI